MAIAIVAAVGMLGTRVTSGVDSARAALASSEGVNEAAYFADGGAPAEPAAAGGGSSSEGVAPGATTSESGSATEETGGAVEAAGTQVPRTLTAADWAVLSGQALINGTTVQTTRAANATWQNTSVMNATPWTDPDITLTSTMRLILPEGVTGYGYGVWLRATPDSSKRTVPSGYSFQVDPGMGNRFALKIWEGGTETLLAMSSFPAGFDPQVDNEVSVTMSGDTFVALVNGTEVLRVNSLTDLAGAKGKSSVPTGTQYGLRAWQKADATMSGTTVGVPSA